MDVSLPLRGREGDPSPLRRGGSSRPRRDRSAPLNPEPGPFGSQSGWPRPRHPCTGDRGLSPALAVERLARLAGSVVEIAREAGYHPATLRVSGVEEPDSVSAVAHAVPVDIGAAPQQRPLGTNLYPASVLALLERHRHPAALVRRAEAASGAHRSAALARLQGGCRGSAVVVADRGSPHAVAELGVESSIHAQGEGFAWFVHAVVDQTDVH